MRHLKAFHIFHVAAKSSSYSKAAQELSITHGAVSKQIKTLEQYLCVSLFYKKGRNVALTPQGKLLTQYTDSAFTALSDGITSLKTVPNHIEVSCEPTLTMRWLMPRLADYYQISKVDVRLSTAGGDISFENTGISMAIRRDDFIINPNYIAEPLVQEWVGPVFSPQYWQKIKNDLEQIVFLHSETRSNAWSLWESEAKLLISDSNKHQTFGHFYFCLQATIDGLGAAIGSYPLVADDIKSGRLVAPFGFSLSGNNYSIIRPNTEMSQSELSFINWLKIQMATCQPTAL
ncbi:MAG: LysR family transcriptional regulator [Gammaproteobacteria bacterium]|nr:LysR family transcriptional regulator [Gammaproteobacteria bacterium]